METSSPVKSPTKKKVFKGNSAMDEDGAQLPSHEEITQREQRKIARELKRKLGRNPTKGEVAAAVIAAGVAGSKKAPIDVEDETTAAGGESEAGSTETYKQPGVESDESTVPEKGKSAKNVARGRGRSLEKSSGGQRAKSVPQKNRSGSKSKAHRGRSIDSSISSKKTAHGDSSESEGSKGKRKAQHATGGKGTKTPKSAKFKDDVPNNEGKTASTKKHAREKAKDSYADKASKDIKKNWMYSTIISYDTRVGKCNDVPKEMYKRMATVLTTCQSFDHECAFGDVLNAKAEPIRSAGDLNWKSHVKWPRYFVLDFEPEWQWDNITGKNPRVFRGAFLLLSDKPASDILRACRVDLRNLSKVTIEVKQMQELHTSLDLILLGVHGNVNTEEIAKDFRSGLMKTELDVINRKKLFDTEKEGFKESVFDEIQYDWTKLDFPDILGVRSYPKRGPYEESKAGQDNSWKFATHFLVADQCMERVKVALAEFIKTGGATALFGSQAIIFSIDEMTKDGKEEYNGLILKHQLTNRSVGSVTLPGAVNIDVEVAMYFEAEQEGKSRPFKMVTLREILSKLYVKIGSRKISAFLYVFKSSNGQYQLWFWDTVPAIREYANLFSRQGPALIWHRCRKWGWQPGPMKRLFNASFDSSTAISAMNSKWSEKKNCAIEISISAEAAAFLNFGNSPFILQEGESKDARHAKKKGVVQRSNLKPDEIGGVDADDLESVGDVSNAKTVFQKGEESEDEDYGSGDEEDDGISRLSDDEEFDIESSDDDEKTINHDFLNESDDEEMEDYDDDHDSAFSTKPDLDDLKEGGRKVRRDSDANFLRRIRELEAEKKAAEQKLQEERAASEQKMNDRMRELENTFETNLNAVLARLKKREEELEAIMASTSAERSASPEAASKGTQEGASSPKDSAGGAPAGNE